MAIESIIASTLKKKKKFSLSDLPLHKIVIKGVLT